jgi:UDP-glucose 4-epimerase
MSIVVIGGAGFIASHAADALLVKGLVVTEFGDLSSEQRENLAVVAGRVVGATPIHQGHAAR